MGRADSSMDEAGASSDSRAVRSFPSDEACGADAQGAEAQGNAGVHPLWAALRTSHVAGALPWSGWRVALVRECDALRRRAGVDSEWIPRMDARLARPDRWISSPHWWRRH